MFGRVENFLSGLTLKKDKQGNQAPQKEALKGVAINLMDSYKELNRIEIEDWDLARNAAYNPSHPSRWRLMSLYEESVLDNHLFAVMDTRILGVINKSFKIKNKDGETDLEKTELITKSWFNKYLKASMESLFYGYTCLQFWTNSEGVVKVKEIPRRHIIPEKNIIIKQLGDQEGIDYTSNEFKKWILNIELENGLGILEKASRMTILKRHSLGSWDLYESRFGIPMIIARDGNQSQKNKDKIVRWLKNLGQAAYGLFSKSTEIEIKESAAQGNHQVFDGKIDRINSEISKLVSGQVATNDKITTYGQAGVQEKTENKRTITDTKLILNHLNGVLIPFLKQHEAYNFLADGDVFYVDDTQTLSPKEKVEIDTKVAGMGYKLTKEYIEKTYDVELEDAQQVEDTETEPKEGEESNALDKKKNQEQSLSKQLDLYYTPCPSCAKDQTIQLEFEDVPDDGIDWEAMVLAIAKKIYQGAKIKEAPKKLRDSIYKLLLDAFTKGFGVYEDFPEKQKAFEFFKKNLYKFSSAKSMFEVLSMQEVLFDAEGAIVSFAEFKKQVKLLNIQFNIHHLKTEYNHVIKAGQAASNWIEYEKDSDLFGNLQYKTKGDKRVRPSHANLNDIILSIDDSFWDMYYPPNGWNCRCFVLQAASDVKTTATSTAKSKGEKAKVSKSFAYNVGKEKKVFEERTHPYFTGTS